MTTVEARVVNPVPTSASVDPVDVVTDNEIADVVLKTEEEKIVDDEEVTSCEGDDVENQMLRVALAKSVVDSGGDEVVRSAVRKRKRPGDTADDEPSDQPDPVNDQPSMPVKADPNIVTIQETAVVKVKIEEAAQQPRGPPDKGPFISAVPVPPPLVPVPPPVKSETLYRAVVVKKELQPPPFKAIGEHKGTTSLKAHIAQIVQVKSATIQPSLPPPRKAIGKPVPVKAKTTLAKPQIKAAAAKAKKPTAPRPRAPRPPQARAVPTPLNHAAPALAAKLPLPAVEPTLKEEDLVATSGAVPNPLLQATPPPPGPTRAYTSAAVLPTNPAEAAVPCPLPPTVPCPLQPAFADKKVTIVEPEIVTTRGRIFSVDLDPSTFDFPDMGDHTDTEKSVAPDPYENNPTDSSIFQRDRAFSFEFFNFSGDDLLPAPTAITSTASSELPDSSAIGSDVDYLVMRRPRGDSIIFDPVSFQDGGIHEKNALLKVNVASNLGPPAGLLPDSRLAAPPAPVISLQKPLVSTPNPLPAYSVAPPKPLGPPTVPSAAGQIATLPSGLSGTAAGGNTPATFQMELLNKDGRIGIYLPDARRARITRFHAKRKMRIWRKRIKYDCRKKLADSRPRIKGRFVKRSDMEEE